MVSRGVMSVGKSSGGAEFVAFYLAEHLADRGDEVVLVSDVDISMLERVPTRMSIAPIRTYRGLGRIVRLVPMDFPRWVLQHLLGNVRAARRARAVLRADVAGFDVVHVHGALAVVLIRRALTARGGQIPLVYTEHDSTPWSCRYRRWFERTVRCCVYREVNLRACRAATAIVANFPVLADELAARAGIPRSRFTTMGNAAEARRLSGHPDPESPQVRHGFDRYYLFVGSLIDRKGPDILLRALTEVGLPCIFVGDGPMRASLERLASKTGISDRVVFTRALERREVRRYYLHAEALVLP
jgi:glycosyltransferase involved in cell wall biosynthesis